MISGIPGVAGPRGLTGPKGEPGPRGQRAQPIFNPPSGNLQPGFAERPISSYASGGFGNNKVAKRESQWKTSNPQEVRKFEIFGSSITTGAQLD